MPLSMMTGREIFIKGTNAKCSYRLPHDYSVFHAETLGILDGCG